MVGDPQVGTRSRGSSRRRTVVGMNHLVSLVPSQRPVSLVASDLDSRLNSPGRVPCTENTAHSSTT